MGDSTDDLLELNNQLIKLQEMQTNAELQKQTNKSNEKNVQATNETNMKINQDMLDYNKAMTQAAWERDDTAHQREVADLEAAGLSPLANTSGLSITNPLSAPGQIPMESFKAQAPQFDVNAMLQSIHKTRELAEIKRHNISQEELQSSSLEMEQEKVNLEFKKLDLQDRKLQADIEIQLKNQDILINQNKELIRHNKELEKNERDSNNLRKIQLSNEQFNKETERVYQEIKKACGGRDIPYKLCTTYFEYQNMLEKRLHAENALLQKYNQGTRVSSSSSEFNSKGSSSSFSVNGVAGGFSDSGSKSKAHSESGSQSNDTSENFRKEWEKLERDYPWPIADYDYTMTNTIKKAKERAK